MDLGLTDKIALVTGSSAGLGFACAEALFHEGARVAICSRDEVRIANAAKKLSGDKSRVLPLACDLSEADQIASMMTTVKAAFGRIDVLVTNNGGPPMGRHDTVDEEKWRLGYDKTFMSTIRLIQQAVNNMKQQGFGRIILLTSAAAKQPIDNLLLSNSYRAGLLGYAKTISIELARFGITVNTVMPGHTATERLNDLAAGISKETGQSISDIYKGWEQAIPAQRLGKPEELGAFVAFLASAQAAYITGTATALDGGRYAGII